MKRRFLPILPLVLTALLWGQNPADMFEQHRPALCRVDFFQNVSSQARIGSYIKVKQHRVGLVAGDSGLILVNSDVYPLSLDILSSESGSYFAAEPSDFVVHLADGSEHPAVFLGKDDRTQLAFLQLETLPEAGLTPVSFSDGGDVRVGDEVYLLELLGESYQFAPLFSPLTINAIIEEPRPHFLVKNGVTALSAGGLVLAADGRAIGVTLRSEPDLDMDGPGDFDMFQKHFLEILPGSAIQPLLIDPPRLEREKAGGKAWLGVRMQALTPALARHWGIPAEGGVVVNRVYPESPAAEAGLAVRDVIVAVEGEPLKVERSEDLDRFRNRITTLPPGETVTLAIYRDGKRRQERVRLTGAPRSVDLAAKKQFSDLGVEVRELTRDILYEFDLPLDAEGVYVYQVDRASPAGLGGLEAGTIIERINRETIGDLADLEKRLADFRESGVKHLMIEVRQPRTTDIVFVDIK